MNTPQHIAKHFREFYFGGNWTYANLKETLNNVTWQQATQQKDSFNSIATLVYHIHYFVLTATRMLQGEGLSGSDKLSFNHPPIQSESDWDSYLTKCWQEAEFFAQLLEKLPEQTLWETFSEEKYGTYYRNLHGIIEHSHYHLGQIAVMKKWIQG